MEEPTVISPVTIVTESPKESLDEKENKSLEQPNNLQNVTSFSPTPSMELWLSTAIDIHSIAPVKVAKKSGLSRVNWPNWKKIPGFMKWFRQEYDYRMDELRQELIEAGAKKAAEDHGWWRDMMILLGVMRPEQFEEQEPKSLNQLNVMAAAFTKSAEERGIVIDATTTGPVSSNSQNGPTTDH